MISNLSATASIAMAIAGTVVANIPELSNADIPLQYGALGILGFMVWAQSIERKRMIASIEEKDAKMLELYRQTLEACTTLARTSNDMIRAVDRCSQTQNLHTRGEGEPKS